MTRGLFSKKVTPSTVRRNDVDVSTLDIKEVEDFIVSLKSKAGTEPGASWNMCHTLAEQLKCSRSLMSILKPLNNGINPIIIFHKYIDIAYSVFNADLVHFFEVDPTNGDLVLSIAHETYPTGIGFRYAKGIGIEGDVLSRNVIANVRDVYTDPRFSSDLDARLGIKTKSMMCVPLGFGNTVRGVVQVLMKQTSTDNTADVGFTKLDETILELMATLLSLTLKMSAMEKSNSERKFRAKSLEAVFSHGISDAELDRIIQKSLNDVQRQLNADRVYLFIHAHGNEQLVGKSSEDNTKVSPSVSIAKQTYAECRMINISREDKRSDPGNKHITPGSDPKDPSLSGIGSLLSMPIISDEGKVIGVLQAVEKLGCGGSLSASFTLQDEDAMRILCTQISFLISKVNVQEATSKSPSAESTDGIVAATVELLKCESEWDLIFKAISAVTVHTASDHVLLYEYISDGQSETFRTYLHSRSPSTETTDLCTKGVDSEAWPIEKLPRPLRDAVKSFEIGSITLDFTVGLHECLVLPRMPAWCAMIYPIRQVSEGISTKKLFLGVGREICEAPYSLVDRKNLNLLADVLVSAFNGIREKSLKHETSLAILQRKQVVERTLDMMGTVAFQLTAMGQILSSSKDFDFFLSACTLSSNRTADVSSIFGSAFGALKDDISAVLSKGEPRSRAAVLVYTKLHPAGILSSYSVFKFPIDTSSETVIHETDSGKTTKQDMSPKDSSVLLLLNLGGTGDRKVFSNGLDGRSTSSSLLTGSMTGYSDLVTQVIQAMNRNFNLPSSAIPYLDQLQHSSNSFQLHIAETDPTSFSLKSTSTQLPPIPQPQPYTFVDSDWPVDSLMRWDFDVLLVPDKNALRQVIKKIFKYVFDFETLKIEEDRFDNFLIEIEIRYRDNPFHNFFHAACVTHICALLIIHTEAKLFIPMPNLFSLLVAAVSHDVDHRGRTNLFEINSGSYLAMLYNDEAVLENHHCSTTFSILREDRNNIFRNFNKEDLKSIRKMMIECILWTDMTKHVPLVKELEKKLSEDGCITNDPIFFGKIVLHAADLSNPVRKFDIERKWGDRINAEFKAQVDVETQLGLPVLPFMIVKDEAAKCFGEKNFVNFTAKPLWILMIQAFPVLTELYQQLEQNINTWQEMGERLRNEAAIEEKLRGSS